MKISVFMFKRPIIVLLVFLIAVIIVADIFLPTVLVRDHYSNHLSESTAFRYLIVDTPKQTARTNSYIAKVVAYKDCSSNRWIGTRGKIKIYIPKTDRNGNKNKIFNYGDVLTCTDDIQRIRNFDSTGRFDYVRYMKHKRIYYQVLALNFDLTATDCGNPVLSLSKKANLFLKKRLSATNMGEDQKNLAVSLLLGDKNDLNERIRHDFNTAGLAHILCVSGLHIMLILSMFYFLMKLITPTNISGLYIRNISAIIICWIMVFVAGFTPSALRVAVMLTLFSISKFSYLNNDRVNILLVTAFIFLCFDPLVLFNVSFQLSFLAVLGIVTLKPWLYKFLTSKLKAERNVFKGLLSNISATTSAQIFTMPIVVFNFGYFPWLFLLSNLVVIPLMQIILLSVILLTIFSGVPVLNNALSQVCDAEMSFLIKTAQLTGTDVSFLQ